jgi:hypothetical protein
LPLFLLLPPLPPLLFAAADNDMMMSFDTVAAAVAQQASCLYHLSKLDPVLLRIKQQPKLVGWSGQQ